MTAPTLAGIAAAQLVIARDDIADVLDQIDHGATHDAVENISTIIRQLEAARRHLA